MASTLAYNQKLMAARGMSRREFIKGVGVTLAGGVLLGIGGQILTNGRLPAVSGWALQRTTFASRLGETFQVRQDMATLPLRLVEVRDLPAIGSAPGVDKEQSFSLLFRGLGDRVLDQGTYSFEYKRSESFLLFIVPMRLSEDASHYEAIFNRPQV